MTDEVISFTPAGQVLTFRDYANAKMILLEKYHHHIIKDAHELAARKTLEDLRYIITRTLLLDLHAGPVRRLLEYTDKDRLAQELWPMLVATGRKSTNVVFDRKRRDAMLPTHITYYCDYVPGEDQALDLSYIKLPPQARILVDMLVDKLQPLGSAGAPEFQMIKWVNDLHASGELVTKQAPWHIFTYYQRQLEAKGFLDVKKPGRR